MWLQVEADNVWKVVVIETICGNFATNQDSHK